MDIKAKIDEVVSKVQSDPSIMSDFQSNPVSAVEKIIGVDLPDDVINGVIDGVKAKLAGKNIADAVGGIGGAIGGLFGGNKQ